MSSLRLGLILRGETEDSKNPVHDQCLSYEAALVKPANTYHPHFMPNLEYILHNPGLAANR